MRECTIENMRAKENLTTDMQKHARLGKTVSYIILRMYNQDESKKTHTNTQIETNKENDPHRLCLCLLYNNTNNIELYILLDKEMRLSTNRIEEKFISLTCFNFGKASSDIEIQSKRKTEFRYSCF